MMPENDPDFNKAVDLQQMGVAAQKAARAQRRAGGPQPRDLDKPLVLTPTRKPDYRVFPDTQEELDLSWLKFEAFDELPEEEARIVIEGLLRAGEKLGITATSKGFKTWLLLYLGYCIANGLDFLGFKTKESRVIFFDFEVPRAGLKRRLKKIRTALGEKGDFKNIKVCSLRGKASVFCNNFEQITARIKEQGFEVVIIDPVYKFLLGKDESANGVVAGMLERLTAFCMEADVALIYVHHHSKGNQSNKDSLDRSSGAGAWSRDPDAVFDLTAHKEHSKTEKIYTAEITVRDFPPIENFVVRWNHPLLERDTEGLDPEELKQPTKGAGRPKSDAGEKIVTALLTAEVVCHFQALTVTQLVTVTEIKRRTVYDTIAKMKGKIVPSALVKGGFQLSPAERAKFPPPDNQNEENPCTD
jgi:hypothetical protein